MHPVHPILKSLRCDWSDLGSDISQVPLILRLLTAFSQTSTRKECTEKAPLAPPLNLSLRELVR
jgi:hypothetical protein